MPSSGVFISSFCKESLSVILQPSILFGLSPFVIIQCGESRVYKLRFHPYYALYSCIVAIILPTIILSGLVIITVHHTISPYKARSINQYIFYLDLGPTTLSVISGVSCAILRRNSFLRLLHHFSKVDQILDLKADPTFKRTTIYVVSATLLVTLSVLIYSYYMWAFFVLPMGDGPMSHIFFTSFCLCVIFTVILILQYCLINNNIRYRVKMLSRRLNLDNLVLANPGETKKSKKRQVLQAICLISEEYSRDLHTSGKSLLTAQFLGDMLKVYEHLQDSLKHTNFLFGPSILVLMCTIITDFIISAYFAVIYSMSYLPVLKVSKEIVWAVFHLFRLILIVEASHRLNQEMEAMRLQICKLLMKENDNYVEEQIETFSHKMLLAPPSYFNPCSMFNISRPLLTTIVSNIMTYLVILVNLFQDSLQQKH